jgi:subtilisin family serine protease
VIKSVRVATIDSGVNPKHPHVEPIAGGIHFTADGVCEDFLDVLGHGTAVAGAIREKAPAAEIYAVKVFDRALVTTGATLMRALDWCLDQSMDFVNLSLGTSNPAYIPGFEERIARAESQHSTIVGAFEMNDRLAFPGSLAGVAGVVLDADCPRTGYRHQLRNGRTVYAACGFPRDIPGVPPQYNLQGISFAVANVTGFLAAELNKL